MINRVSAHPSIGLAVGGVLAVLGLGLLLARVVDPGPHAWVLLLLLPGATLAALGLTTNGRAGLVVTLAGCIIAGKGLLLLWSTTVERWEIWAYGWPLWFLGSVGLGLLARGLLRNDPEMTSIGGRLTFVGLGLFAFLFLVFEGMVFNSLGGVFGVIVPLLLVGAGVLLVVRSLRTRP